MTRKIFSFIVICGGLMAAACVSTSSVAPVPRAAPPEDETAMVAVLEAEHLLDMGDPHGAQDRLDSLPQPAPETVAGGRYSFVAGKSLLALAEIEMAMNEGGAGILKGLLPRYVVDMLTEARDLLLWAGESHPDDPYAAEAMYLAGRTMDHGYLQDFPAAMDIYRWAGAAYPQSEFGKLAGDRFRELERKMGHMKDTSHEK